uniref:Uncharacterized protein n=1 Tax=Moniliophthora roreri TaxID=221103 RepID=A0A0W0EZK7_MONRR
MVFFDMNPAACAATAQPFENPTLNALQSGFSVVLDEGYFGGPPCTFVSTFSKPHSKLATPPQFLAALYHRLPDTVAAVEFAHDTPYPLLALFTKLFELHLYWFFHGKGVPSTYTSVTTERHNKAALSDPFFRFKMFIYATTGLHSLPPKDDYQICFKITTATLLSKSICFPNHVPPPLNIHTCFAQINVHMNDGMWKMLLDIPDTPTCSTAFDAWFFSQIISNSFNAI